MAGVRRPPPVARVLERVTATAREHDMFQPGDLVLVSVSGGPDSICLLYSLWHLRRLFKIKLAVFHFDHKLRPDSGKDEEYVRRLAERLELPLYRREAEDAPAKGESVEAWARTARSKGATESMREAKARRLAKGHTLDDQAETVLMALVRGGGLHALAGIRPSRPPEVNPLLNVTRVEVEDFCRALHLRPRLDPTNADTHYLRNALRLEGIPALERATGRELKGPMARTAELLWPVVDEWNDLIRSSEPAAPQPGPEGALTIDAAWLAEGPDGSTADTLRRWLTDMPSVVSKEMVDALIDLAKGRPGRKRDLSGGLKAWRDHEYVHVARTSPEPRTTKERGSA